ncbi:ribosome maturation factor RimM [Primorskyibacter flagellatus]|uniref:Ribosome maturation factor RimM n=1 Tax=Primorskyibacter flagellatus TaxID=1387277 RepID=A0A917ABH9_9RHOB|nr:ribosome maturation factor RimM [Primorskyibacter flagellatus]GGE38195.1 ribosome maturation factor RimM [Primorskyibacter flagellatus]
MADQVCVGAIAGAFGVRGEVRLKSFCADPESIADYSPLTGDNGVSYSVTLSRPISNGFAAWLGGVETKEQADALKGVQLFAPRDRLPVPEDEEYYHADLIGLRVVDTGGTEIGVIRAVHDHGAGDLLEIMGPGLKATVLLPFTRVCVPTVDLAGGKVVADPPEGLF